MNRKRIIYVIVPLLILIPLVALATDYDWTGGTEGDFDVYTNWSSDTECGVPQDCYPRTCNDDATIEIAGGDVTVDMSTETIDDLKLISGEDSTLTLDGEGTQKTLTCDSLMIDLTAGYSGDVVLIEKGIIKTEACP